MAVNLWRPNVCMSVAMWCSNAIWSAISWLSAHIVKSVASAFTWQESISLLRKIIKRSAQGFHYLVPMIVRLELFPMKKWISTKKNVEVLCSNNCNRKVNRQYLASYTKTECPCHKVTCQYYHQIFISGQHIEECPKLHLPCPNACEVGTIPCEDMEKHKINVS